MNELDVSLAICTHTADRWAHLAAAVDSARQQVTPPREIILVVDHNPSLYARVRQTYAQQETADSDPRVVVVENTGKQGLSDARNTALATASGALVAFLDDDAIAAPDWLARLRSCFEDPQVLAAGGTVDPKWVTRQPWWFPDEFLWVVGCTYRGVPTAKADVRNVFGGCMLVRRSVAEAAGGFRTEIGRVGKRPAGCEETEFCIRARVCFPTGRIVYEPAARIAHVVPAARTRWSYFQSRCYFEGRSKALITRFVGADDGLASERRHAMRVLPAGVVRSLSDLLRYGDLRGLGCASAIVCGLTITTAGYLVGRIANRLAPATTPEIGVSVAR
jgi:GT2 family glycosyltransferase